MIETSKYLKEFDALADEVQKNFSAELDLIMQKCDFQLGELEDKLDTFIEDATIHFNTLIDKYLPMVFNEEKWEWEYVKKLPV